MFNEHQLCIVYMTQAATFAKASVIMVHLAFVLAAFSFSALPLSSHFLFFFFFCAELTTTGRLLKSQFAENFLLHFLRARGKVFHRIKV